MITMKDLIIDKAHTGGYGFTIERIMQDYRVKNAHSFNFRDCVRDALIDYATEQLKVAQYCGYSKEIVDFTLDKLQKQFEAFETFDNDWELACLLDELNFQKAMNAMRKEGVENE